MVAYRILFLAGAVAALPLNINLGAYSPALVVGDGEISFGGNSDVNSLMSVLQGAAVAAANNGAATGAPRPGPAAAPVAAPAAAPVAQPVAAPAAPPAAAAGAVVEGANANLLDQVGIESQQIAALQGMGKAVLPRQEDASSNIGKRDLASFDRALKFAEVALGKGPKIQLGTGREGSGVGIIVDNNPTAAARPGTAKKAKRDLPGSGRVKVTTMYVRSGIPSSLQSGNAMSARSVEGDNVEPRYETIQIAPTKRDGSSQNAIDAVNLNVSGDQGVTMTFVETIEDEDNV